MSSSLTIDNVAEAFESLRKSHEDGRLAHAYIIVGSPRGEGLTFAESVLKLLYCTGAQKPCGACPECARVMARSHPDIVWIEPESKSRKITIDRIQALRDQMSQTSYAGSWKAAVLLHADRVQWEGWNAFLKTLEEPTPRTLFLLLTDSPQSLMPTVVSRCQRIVLSSAQQHAEGEWLPSLIQTLRTCGEGGALERMALAGRIKGILDAEKEKITAAEKASLKEEEDIENDVVAARISAAALQVRTDIMLNLLLWKRDVLLCVVGGDPELLHFPDEREALQRQAAGKTYAQAAADVDATRTLIRRLERYVPDVAALEACFLQE